MADVDNADYSFRLGGGKKNKTADLGSCSKVTTYQDIKRLKYRTFVQPI